MIPKITFFAVLACVSLLRGISGASYSKVFVQSGPELVPVDYVNYGPPVESQIAQISAAPVDSIVSFPSVPAIVSPCVAPCVIPGSPLSAMAPISSTASAKIVAYKSPIANVPVLLANKDDATSYQYAYAVYDESTGDKKTQSEQSNGSVVQGQYSFIQPDGYRREVVYTADDLKGFNAVVRNFLPESASKSAKKSESDADKKDLPPCKEVKSEQLVEKPPTEAPKESINLEVDSIAVENEKTKEVTTPPTPAEPSKPTKPDNAATYTPDSNANALVSYNDIIGCLQAKLQTNNNSSGISPLTYILIPTFKSFGKLC